MPRLIYCLVVCCVLGVVAPASGQSVNTPPLDGAFIQLDNDMLAQLRPDDWRAVLDQMNALKMKTVIVMYLGQAANDGEKPPPFLISEKGRTDPVVVLLEHAAKLKMKVYLGLVNPPGTGDDATNARPGYWKKENLSSFAKANSTFAKSVAAKYGDQPAFHGWYIPLENWIGLYDYDPVEEWTEFYKTITTACKAATKTPKPVMISPCLPAKNYRKPAKEAATIYGKLLKGTGLDVVMLQDSVAVRASSLTIKEAASYLQPLAEVCKENKIAFWSNLECMDAGKKGWVPCMFDRFKQQLEATDGVEKRVTFEFFHYMNGKVYLKDWSPDYRKRMNDVFTGYKKYID